MEKYITCKTEAECKKLMKALEKDGYKWSNGQSLTSDSVYHHYGKDTVVRLYPNKLVVFADRDFYESTCGVKNFIPAMEYIGKNTLVIYRNGNAVTAVNKATGETGIAICSPSDEFDFNVGAAIALARLLTKDHNAADNKDVKTEWKKLLGIEDSPAKKYTDADRNFKVGDRVVVREWDDMAEEYVTGNGTKINADRSTSFVNNMRHLCGRTATVTGVRDDDYVFVDFDDKSGDTEWYYKKWMFNPSDDAPARDNAIREGDTVKVVDVGLNYSSYPQWVGKHISDPYMAARYRFSSPDTERKYKVIKIAEHENNGKMLAFIEECDGLGYNRCYLIEVRGLEKV